MKDSLVARGVDAQNIILDGKPSEYIALARQSGSEWFAAAMTNNNARTVTIPLDFLPAGKEYKMTSFADGI